MKTLVLGGTGLLGSEFVGSNFIKVCSKDVNLTNIQETLEFFSEMRNNGVERVIHAAAKVGGVKINMEKMAEFFDENVKMNVNVLKASETSSMKLVTVLSTCVYPTTEYVTYPLTEDQLHNGPPHQSNFGYAYAKRMCEVQSRAYRQQYGCNFISVIPNNLYGVNDNYDLNSGHVIPALIRKFYKAKFYGCDHIDIWGTGVQLREFTFARDVAKIILWLAENYNGEKPVNIGNPEQISIINLAQMIAEEFGFCGYCNFDETKPAGQFEKPSSNAFLRSLGCDIQYTSLRDGLKETINSFKNRYPNVRGVIPSK